MIQLRRAIGLEIGETKIVGGVVDSAGTVLTELVELRPDESDADADAPGAARRDRTAG